MNGGQIRTVDANTKLLIHFDGIDNQTTFTDDGTNTHTVTTNGGAKVATSTSKFGQSGYFDGTGDFLSIADHADWNFGTTALTIDFWIKFDDPTAGDGIFRQQDDASNHFGLYYTYNSGDPYFTFYHATGAATTLHNFYWDYAGSSVPQVGQWYHIALIRGWASSANRWALTVNGAAVFYSGGSNKYVDDSVTMPNLTGDLEIGRSWTTPDMFTGHLDEFRISNTARWTADFTPPTTEYPAGDSSGTVVEVAHTYTEDELPYVKYTQSADTLYIVHPDHAPAKLTRSTHVNWTLSTITFHYPAFLDINTTATTLVSDNAAVGAGRTITASASLFNANHVGASFAFKNGYVIVTAYTSATEVTATVRIALDDTVATADWYESVWSTNNGFPSSVTFHEDRLALAGCANTPDRVDLSITSEYENFGRGELWPQDAASDDSIAITLLSREVNAIRWMASTRKLLLGTTGGEWWIEGATSSEPLDATATSLTRMDSALGSANILPVIIGNDIIFLQRASKVLRNYGYTWEKDKYEGKDISVIAEHLLSRGSITELSWQQTPHKVCWAVRDDGYLLGLTFMPEHDVIGWHKHPATGTSAAFESIATIEGDEEDELYCIVKRTINSSTVRYIEKLTPLVAVDTGEGGSSDYDLEDSFLVDSGLTYRGAAATSISGLTHLEGEGVAILADGVPVTGKTVASGAITLSTAASVVHIGLGYNSNLELLDPVVGGDEEGIVQGIGKRVTNAVLNLYRTVNGQIGPDSSNLSPIRYPSGTSTTDFYSGYTEDTAIYGGNERSPNVYIRANEPLPMTVLAAILEVEV
jgi:hypothetical protein